MLELYSINTENATVMLNRILTAISGRISQQRGTTLSHFNQQKPFYTNDRPVALLSKCPQDFSTIIQAVY